MNDETQIPDFRCVTNFEDIQQRFISAARSMMLEYEIVFGDRPFNITSLELYLRLHKQSDLWDDPATDKGDESKEQYNRGTWYVRQKKGPAYWRIDITAGNVAEYIQAGILIRQLNGKSGPATAFQSFIRGGFGRHSWNQEELNLIERIHGKRVDGSDGSPLKLKRRLIPLNVELAKGKRKNLPKSEAKNREGIFIRDAALRVSVWKRYSSDERIAACN